MRDNEKIHWTEVEKITSGVTKLGKTRLSTSMKNSTMAKKTSNNNSTGSKRMTRQLMVESESDEEPMYLDHSRTDNNTEEEASALAETRSKLRNMEDHIELLD